MPARTNLQISVCALDLALKIVTLGQVLSHQLLHDALHNFQETRTYLAFPHVPAHAEMQISVCALDSA